MNNRRLSKNGRKAANARGVAFENLETRRLLAFAANINFDSGNIWGETPHAAMGNQITALVKAASPASDYITVHTVVGESGQRPARAGRARVVRCRKGHDPPL